MESSFRSKRFILSKLFILIILSVSLATLININTGRSEAENRSLARFPHLTFDREGITAFPARFEQFFHDRFGFRRQLVYLNSLIRVRLLKTSPLDKVVVGRDGWLFYADEHAMAVDPLTPGLLELWRVSLEAKQAWLKSQGIDYLFMVVPDKQTIYPEYLPGKNRPYVKNSNIDLLIDYLQRRSTVRLLDVRPRLLAAKGTAPVYYKTDTHWNQLGAAVACEELLRRVAERSHRSVPTIIPSTPPKISPVKGKDMAAMLLLQNLMNDEEVDPGIPVGAAKFIINDEATPDGLLMSTSIMNETTLPRGVVFHDSYFNAMKPYFARHFSRLVMAGGNSIHKFPLEVIDRERPDLVVEEIVERYLTGAPKLPGRIDVWYKAYRGDRTPGTIQ